MPEAHPKPDPMRRILACGCLAPLILVIAVAVGVLVWARVQLDSLRDDVNAQGEPLTLEALNNYYEEPPPGENGARFYTQASQALQPPPEVNMDFVPMVGTGDIQWKRGEAWPDNVLQSTRKYIEANRAALYLVHEAATYDAVRFPVDFRLAPNLQTPHLARLRDVARHASLEASFYAREGDIDAALNALDASAHTAAALCGEPLLISQLVQVACTHVFIDSAADMLSVQPLTSGQLDRFAQIADVLPDPFHCGKQGYIGERAFFLSQSRTMGIPVLRNIDRMVYVGRMTELIELCDAPPRTIVDRAQSIGAVTAIPVLSRFLTPMTGITMPALSRSIDAFARAAAFQRALDTAIAIERYRIDNGELPDTLDQLVPNYLESVPADPFSDDPILYLRQNPGYVLYSVGPNRRDDEGAPIGSNQTGDIPLRVNR